MSRTQLRTRQIQDGTINSDDVDVTSAKAMVTRVYAGTNIKITGEAGNAVGAGPLTVSVDMFGEWAQGVQYALDTVIKYKGIMLKVNTAHDTTGLTFQECLEYYTPISTSMRIINSPGHGIPRFRPVYLYNQTQVRPARSDVVDTCSTHFTLDVNNNWLLIVDVGEYTYAGHGIGGTPPAAGTIKSLYLSATNAAELTESKVGLTNICPVVTVLDANRFMVTTYRGITNLDTQGITVVTRPDLDTVTSGKAVIAKVKAGAGISISSTGVDSGTGDVTVSAQVSADMVTVVASSFDGNLSATVDTVQKLAQAVDDMPSAIGSWKAGVQYGIGKLASWRGIMIEAVVGHTSSPTFADDLGKWKAISTNARIVSQASHYFGLLTPIYFDGAGLARKALANSDATCADFVVIDYNSTYFLCVDSGTYEIETPEFLTLGTYLCSETSEGQASISGGLGVYENPVYQLIDHQHVRILSYKDTIYHGEVFGTSQAVVSSASLTGQVLDYSFTVPVLATRLTIELDLSAGELTSPSATVYLQFNDDATSASYYNIRSYYNSSTNVMTNDDYTSPGMYLGNVGYAHTSVARIFASEGTPYVTALIDCMSHVPSIAYRMDISSRYVKSWVGETISKLRIYSSSGTALYSGNIRIYAGR